MAFTLKSAAVIDGKIADQYGSRGGDNIDGIPQLSFPLEWKGAPNETKSFVLLFRDFDNFAEEGFSFLHWAAADIPASTVSLPEDAGRTEEWLVQGKNGWILEQPHDKPICNRYGGPAPLAGCHEYEIKLYALSESLGMKPGFYYGELRKKMRGKVLDTAILCGTYEK